MTLETRGVSMVLPKRASRVGVAEGSTPREFLRNSPRCYSHRPLVHGRHPGWASSPRGPWCPSSAPLSWAVGCRSAESPWTQIASGCVLWTSHVRHAGVACARWVRQPRRLLKKSNATHINSMTLISHLSPSSWQQRDSGICS